MVILAAKISPLLIAHPFHALATFSLFPQSLSPHQHHHRAKNLKNPALSPSSRAFAHHACHTHTHSRYTAARIRRACWAFRGSGIPGGNPPPPPPRVIGETPPRWQRRPVSLISIPSFSTAVAAVAARSLA